ncbi:hypothetical protein ACG873_01235 (plasmid) [Mesorhizobium sp. AaZ16]|uniref:hypothetical protein n=1 Tax=Mesorhizobium sp. AaZ16 TaxID=3402289 RepID=UPI00374FAF90
MSTSIKTEDVQAVGRRRFSLSPEFDCILFDGSAFSASVNCSERTLMRDRAEDFMDQWLDENVDAKHVGKPNAKVAKVLAKNA